MPAAFVPGLVFIAVVKGVTAMVLTWYPQLANRESPAIARSQRAGARRKHGQRLQLERLETRLAPALHVWSGANSVTDLG
jgi:hypothetical protein